MLNYASLKLMKMQAFNRSAKSYRYTTLRKKLWIHAISYFKTEKKDGDPKLYSFLILMYLRSICCSSE